jgi:hypothetical protein
LGREKPSRKGGASLFCSASQDLASDGGPEDARDFEKRGTGFKLDQFGEHLAGFAVL